MPTLYVENVPKDLYEALRNQAKKHHRSIAAEVLTLLEDHVPTEKELKAREETFKKLKNLRFTKSPDAEPLPSSLDMIREDRER